MTRQSRQYLVFAFEDSPVVKSRRPKSTRSLKSTSRRSEGKVLGARLTVFNRHWRSSESKARTLSVAAVFWKIAAAFLECCLRSRCSTRRVPRHRPLRYFAIALRLGPISCLNVVGGDVHTSLVASLYPRVPSRDRRGEEHRALSLQRYCFGSQFCQKKRLFEMRRERRPDGSRPSLGLLDEADGDLGDSVDRLFGWSPN